MQSCSADSRAPLIRLSPSTFALRRCYGGDGLARFLASQKNAEKKAKRVAAIEVRSVEIEKRQSEFDAREKEFGLLQKQLESREAAQANTADALVAKEADLQKRLGSLKANEERNARSTAELKEAQEALKIAAEAAAARAAEVESEAISNAELVAASNAPLLNDGVPEAEVLPNEASTAPFELIDESSSPACPVSAKTMTTRPSMR